MRIETHQIEGETLFWADLEGESVESLIGALHPAAAEMSTDVYEAQDGDGSSWTLFGDGSRVSFGLRIESVGGKGALVTPLYLEADGEDVPLEDVALLLQRAVAMLTEPDEVARAISDIAEMAPKRHPPEVDPLTGVVDNDDITVEIMLDERWIIDGEEHSLEGFGGTLRLTPPPRPVEDF